MNEQNRILLRFERGLMPGTREGSCWHEPSLAVHCAVGGGAAPSPRACCSYYASLMGLLAQTGAPAPPARTLSISAGWGCQKNSSHPDLDLANGGTQRVQSVCAFFSFFCLAVGLVISALSNALKLDDCLRDGQPQRPSARAAPGAQLDANKKQL